MFGQQVACLPQVARELQQHVVSHLRVRVLKAYAKVTGIRYRARETGSSVQDRQLEIGALATRLRICFGLVGGHECFLVQFTKIKRRDMRGRAGRAGTCLSGGNVSSKSLPQAASTSFTDILRYGRHLVGDNLRI